MTRARTLSRPAMLLAAALLTGCVSLFPESEPAQLYRFGESVPRAQPPSAAPAVTVLLGSADLDRAAAGDRILTINGTQASYIKGARWVTSAQDLFHAALRQAFDNAGAVRLVEGGDVARPGYVLELQVHSFEARYTRGPDTAPDVLVAMQATLTETDDRALAGRRAFSATVSAGDNRVGAIVEAFDRAVAKVTGELVAWVEAEGTAG